MYRIIILSCILSCGLSTPLSRIIGGVSIPIDDTPYIGYLSANGQHACGASIIGKNVAISAAHCMRYPTEMVVGTNNRISGGQRHKIIDIKIHPNYNGSNLVNDIAIIWVETNFYNHYGTRQISPITLASTVPTTGSLVQAAGWGSASLKGSQPILLQQVSFNIDNSITQRNPKLCTNKICVDNELKGICLGDSGGPLTFENQLIGITSGSSCEGFSLFTDVSKYYQWITDEISKHPFSRELN